MKILDYMMIACPVDGTIEWDGNRVWKNERGFSGFMGKTVFVGNMPKRRDIECQLPKSKLGTRTPK